MQRPWGSGDFRESQEAVQEGRGAGEPWATASTLAVRWQGTERPAFIHTIKHHCSHLAVKDGKRGLRRGLGNNLVQGNAALDGGCLAERVKLKISVRV